MNRFTTYLLVLLLCFLSFSCTKEEQDDKDVLEYVLVDPSELVLTVGDKTSLVPVLSPNNLSEVNISWESENEDVATVNSQGEVLAVSEGITEIYLTAMDKSDTCYLTVKPIDIEKLILSEDEVDLFVDESIELTLRIYPESASNQTIIWTSSNSSLANVTENGVVNAIAQGEVEIKAIASSGAEAVCRVLIKPVPEREYTVMLYGCAGGDLDDYILHNLSQAQESEYSNRVKMTALIKYSKHKQGDQEGTIFYDLKEDGFQDEKYSDELFDLSDPKNLSEYIKKSVELYPAEKYILILTNHGGEWNAEYDVPNTRSLIYDDNTGEVMSIYSLDDGIRMSGVDFDLIYPDLCLFGMLEFISQIKDHTKYVLSSANLIPGYGGNYKFLLDELKREIPLEDALKSYIILLIDYWTGLVSRTYPLDISLINSQLFDEVYDPIIKFKDRFLEISTSDDLTDIYNLFLKAQSQMYFLDNNLKQEAEDFTDADLLDAFKQVAQSTQDEIFISCYEDLKNALGLMTIRTRSRNFEDLLLGEEGFSFGIQWNISDTYNEGGFEKGYESSIFNQKTNWSDFLRNNK